MCQRPNYHYFGTVRNTYDTLKAGGGIGAVIAETLTHPVFVSLLAMCAVFFAIKAMRAKDDPPPPPKPLPDPPKPVTPPMTNTNVGGDQSTQISGSHVGEMHVHNYGNNILD